MNTKERKLTSTHSAIGTMAGSSMDGLDVVHVTFNNGNGNWSFKVEKGLTIEYGSVLYNRLKESPSLSVKEQKEVDVEFGKWIGVEIAKLIGEQKVNLDLLAVHGHTVVHQPECKISWQLGSGEEILKETDITTITDFRSHDISLGGQGAPLVPMGDFHLFSEYDACLNLGGIANVSIKETQTAWDITPCNQLLNFYANQLDKDFDENGLLARNGFLNVDFLQKIENIDFFKAKAPKSLPNNFISKEVLNQLNPADGLRTMTEFIAKQVASDLQRYNIDHPKILITGGGAYNDFLIERLKYYLSDWEVIIPSKSIIDFKEAIVFAFLGVLRMRNEVNVLATVTGASKDSCSGVIHFAK